MSCSITFTINDEGKLITKAKWDKKNLKNIGRFRKFLANLQSGKHNFDICGAIVRFGENSLDNKNARRILKMLVPSDESRNEPIIFPQELGKEISGND